MNITVLVRILFVLTIASAQVALRAATVTVFAAASLTDSLREIAHNYEQVSGDQIEFNFAGSSVLERQIEEGAPADLFFSADEAKMNTLEKKGMIIHQSRKNRLSNSLVIVIPSDSSMVIASPDDLSNPKIEHLALADPKAVPAGIYAREYLQKIHLWSRLVPKVVPTSNVRAALAAVESGDAEAGIVYKTDAAISKKVRVAYEIPRADGPKITYPLALVKNSSEPKAAAKFLDYLDSKTAGRVFEKFGFIVDTSSP